MEIIKGLENLRVKYPEPVVTIGNFDGVHKGHQLLFSTALKRSKAISGTAMAMTFEPHPIRVLRPAVNLPLITPLAQKLELMQGFGLDVALCIRFDEDFARLSADDFVDKLLVARLGVSEVVVGHDFAFGRKGMGDVDLLKAKGLEHGFKVHQEGPVLADGRPVSSTRVRQMVAGGDLKGAASLLGRNYRVAGRVAPGRGRGASLLGFPTANLKVTDELLPCKGVFAVIVELAGGEIQKGVTNIGSNPTFEDGGLNVETHILDFDRDIYDQEIKLHFMAHLRPEKRFSSVEELVAQIKKDTQTAREILG